MTLILEIALGIVLGVILLNVLGFALELLVLAWEKLWEFVEWVCESIAKAAGGITRLLRRTAK